MKKNDDANKKKNSTRIETIYMSNRYFLWQLILFGIHIKCWNSDKELIFQNYIIII